MLGNFSLGTFAWELSLGHFRLETRLVTFAWELSLGNFRLEMFAWEFELGDFRLGTFAWEISFGHFRLGTLAPGSQAWGTGLLRLGELVGGTQRNPEGRLP